MAAYDGNAIFGSAVRVGYNFTQVVAQENAFFGLNNTQELHGGTRGGLIQVTGVLSGESIDDVVNAQQLLNSYVDGIPRTFVDNFGRQYDNVKVVNYLTPDPMGIRPSNLGYSMAYSVVLRWLGQ